MDGNLIITHYFIIVAQEAVGFYFLLLDGSCLSRLTTLGMLLSHAVFGVMTRSILSLAIWIILYFILATTKPLALSRYDAFS